MKRSLLPILMPLLVAGFCHAQQEDRCAVVVTLHWPDHDLSRAQVRVARDQQGTDLVGAFPATDAEGKVILLVPPGNYYLTAVVDNGDGQFGPGDGLGFHGVSDLQKDERQPLEIREKAWAVTISISLMMNDERKLVPTGVQTPRPPAPTGPYTITGSVGDPQGLTLVYAVPKTGPCAADTPGPEGAFQLSVASDEVYLFAVRDTNGNQRADVGDLMGVHGYQPGQGREFPTVKLTGDLAEVDMKLTWLICGDGLLRSTSGEGEGPAVAPQTFPGVIYGRLLPQTTEPLPATVRAAADSRFQNLVGSVSTNEGTFVLCVPQGTYFVSFLRDRDSNGQPSAADELGFHGVTDLAEAGGPEPLVLGPGDIRKLDLTVSARLNEALQPIPAR